MYSPLETLLRELVRINDTGLNPPCTDSEVNYKVLQKIECEERSEKLTERLINHRSSTKSKSFEVRRGWEIKEAVRKRNADSSKLVVIYYYSWASLLSRIFLDALYIGFIVHYLPMNQSHKVVRYSKRLPVKIPLLPILASIWYGFISSNPQSRNTISTHFSRESHKALHNISATLFLEIWPRLYFITVNWHVIIEITFTKFLNLCFVILMFFSRSPTSLQSSFCGAVGSYLATRNGSFIFLLYASWYEEASQLSFSRIIFYFIWTWLVNFFLRYAAIAQHIAAQWSGTSTISSAVNEERGSSV